MGGIILGKWTAPSLSLHSRLFLGCSSGTRFLASYGASLRTTELLLPSVLHFLLSCHTFVAVARDFTLSRGEITRGEYENRGARWRW